MLQGSVAASSSATAVRGPVAKAMALALLVGGTAGFAGSVAADETQVSTAPIIDYEFYQAPGATDGMMAFIDGDMRLWESYVDTNGNFYTNKNGVASGQQVFLDACASPSPQFGNGVEWMQDANGIYLIYTKFVTPDCVPTNIQGYPTTTKGISFPTWATVANATIGLATYANGVWGTPVSLPGSSQFIEPVGNVNPLQTDVPAVFRYEYQSTNQTLYYQGVNDAAPTAVRGPQFKSFQSPGPAPTSTSSGTERYVPGMNALVYTAETTDADGTAEREAWMYDLTTKTYTQLTSDVNSGGNDKGDKSAIFMWQAPEFNNDYVFFAESKVVIGNHTTYNINFYHNQFVTADNKNEWVRVYQITKGNSPTDAPPYIWSPEPFVFNGKSYVFFERCTSDPTDLHVATHIYLVSMDDTVNTELSDPTLTVQPVRMDPEVFITAQGPYIYYNEYNVKSAAPTGVWRSNTNLGAPAP